MQADAFELVMKKSGARACRGWGTRSFMGPTGMAEQAAAEELWQIGDVTS